MFLALLQAIAGLGLLVIAGDILVRGAAALAENFGLPPLLIGLTIVAFGTSAPELFVGVDAVLRGAPTLALGNVVGSNIANALLVLGLPALLAPLTCSAPKLNRNMAVMLAATVLFIALAMGGQIGFFEGMVLFIGLIAFLVYSGIRAKADPKVAEEFLEFEEDLSEKRRPWLSGIMVLGGCAGLVLGANLLVDGSVFIATTLGVPEAVIGLTLVALGTSLPELATSIAAALRCQCDVALGNVIGSNIFNLLGIMGVTAMVGNVPVPDSFFQVDLWVMLGASLAILPFTLKHRPLGRIAGLGLVLAYAAYIGWLAYDGISIARMAAVGL
ncbi:sodium:calcium antiporter [Iodidimonas gelatinilytica]|uniref:Sodium:calcium antiporter n=1 Tax=Iodidimonas gelatinilytica TaxID=1236966 RepID=A0A5A7MX27_9PROT|nr:calcium/sodium antiporter [Iodidimonas gelatinilytica]GEQ97988.1 sodium:calcium antiporter [Iodidimonas gelatinilytica]GEQ99893.1 sodium:calcium antiporter [Iodidimonas gelatinilytica]